MNYEYFKDKRVLALIGAVLLVFIDQISKQYFASILSKGEYIEVLPVLNWVLLHNSGAAFSLFADFGGIQRYFLVLISFAFSCYMIWEIVRWKTNEQLLQLITYGLLLGGAFGNFIDRLLFGYVIDFISLHYGRHYFPAFNVADMCITVGAVFWFYCLLLEVKADRSKANS